HPRHKIVRYEDLVQTPEAATRDLFEFLDEPFTPEVISDFQQNSRTRNLEKVHQPKLQSGISTEWVGRWQKPEHAERVDSFRRHPQAMQWLVQSGYSEKGLP